MKSRLSKLKLIVFAILLTSATFDAFAFQKTTWFRAKGYSGYDKIDLAAPIMSSEQYSRVINTHSRPYIVSAKSGAGNLLLYGATHTKDPADSQIADIKKRFTDFRPTVVLVEGRLGFFSGVVKDSITRFGENGFVRFLAVKENITVYTWEMPLELEVAAALKNHQKERVALFYILRPYFGNLRHGKPKNPEKYVERFRARRTKVKGLENAFSSIEDIDRVWKRDFEGKPDWRNTSDEYGLPNYLKSIATDSGAARNEHFARVIIDLVRKGNRVFATAGLSHAVKLDKTLRTTLAN